MGLSGVKGGGGKLKFGVGKVPQDSSEHLVLLLLLCRCRERPNPMIRPVTTSAETMKMKIFVAFPT